MYIPIWIIVIGIIIYFVWRVRKPKIISKAKGLELIQDEIDKKENYVLQKIKGSHIADYMQTETTLFECGKKNFIRLQEGFRHDDKKLGESIKDWIYYLDYISNLIHHHEMLDLATSDSDADDATKQHQEIVAKMQEIDKRTRDLLGKDYTDPTKLL